MVIFHWIILAFWLLFIAYWAISAIGAKRSVPTRTWWTQSTLSLVILSLIVIALRVPLLSHTLRSAQAHEADSMLMGAIGAVCTALGIGLAIFARAYLGRNWGVPMSRKENPELVTGGPYAFIRHPIYAGVILAMLGSMIGESVYWTLPLILFGAYFIYSARREEELMSTQFPEQYPSYIGRTKMFVPFQL